MANKGFMIRVLPFLAAFAIGIFITSFFVNIRGRRFHGRHFQEIHRLQNENEQLRNENLRLRNELENGDAMPSHTHGLDGLPEPMVHDHGPMPPPPAPPRHKHDR